MMYTELVREGSFVTVDVPAIVGIRIGPWTDGCPPICVLSIKHVGHTPAFASEQHEQAYKRWESKEEKATSEEIVIFHVHCWSYAY